MVNPHFEICFKTNKNFVNFVKLNTERTSEYDDEHMSFLAQRVAMNMFYYPNNIATAKADYMTLLAVLIKKGIIYEEYKDLVPKEKYPNK